MKYSQAAEDPSSRRTYQEEGWFKFSPILDRGVISYVCSSIQGWTSKPPLGAAFEADGATLRAVHGCHLYDDTYERLARLPMLLDTAREILEDDVYVYQFKINIKHALEGREWPWHTDFSFWSNEDGMPSPRAVNIAVNVDDVREENGPILLLSGSHRGESIPQMGTQPSSSGSDWQANVSAELPYTVEESMVQRLLIHHPQTPLLGPAGSVFAFHPNIIHSSSRNRSRQRRSILIITYNAVSNVPKSVTRPEFLVGRDPTPLQPLDGTVL
ncbi:phytanoyl-CoA dioxygenase family protein [Streptomyces mirabilis]|uniref:phytanoyl-CoA dioxygenase family protein n=1 Tax=Streptomyces mirabilis TaxID=68239 RepID=UPI00332E0B33